jgi:hypothetical protein
VNVTVSAGADDAAVAKYHIHLAFGAIVFMPVLLQGAMLYAPRAAEQDPLTHWYCEAAGVQGIR